jgi:hypothetical protein
MIEVPAVLHPFLKRALLAAAVLAAPVFVPAVVAQEAPAPTPAPPPPAAAPAAPAVATKGARLRGIVLNAEDGLPLPGADVVLVGLDMQVRAGESGRFDFGVIEAGSYIVQSRMLGFQPYTVRAELADSSTLELTFRMKRQAFQLDEIVVTEQEQKRGRFYERMAESRGFGTFVTRDEIAKRNTPFTCDLLRGKLGLRVIQTGTTCNIRMSRNQGASFQNADCAPGFYLDGARSDIQVLEQNSLPPTVIEGIEIYRSAAEAPSELNQGNFCGVIAMWTRTGR